jgi:intein/homing endonuclease
MFISDGSTTKTTLCMAMKKQRKRDYIKALEEPLGIRFNYGYVNSLNIGRKNAKGIFESFEKLSVGALNKYLPDFVWRLGINNCRALLEGLLNGDGSHNLQGSECYYTSSPKLASDVQRLALHCGYSGTIKKIRDAGHETKLGTQVIKANADTLSVRIVKTKNEPTVNHGHVHEQEIQEEKWVEFSGKVGCFEIPNTHLFYYKKDVLEPPCWTGNSSRSG